MTKYFCDICGKEYQEEDDLGYEYAKDWYENNLRRMGDGAVFSERLQCVHFSDISGKPFTSSVGMCSECEDKLNELIREFVKSRGA